LRILIPIIVILLVSGPTIAENLEVELHITSYRFDDDDDGYEEDNYDLCATDEFIYAIGAIGGLVTGYEDNIDHTGDLYPIILPGFKISYQKYFVKSRFITNLGENASLSLHYP
jgi:hypothetical protein